MNDQLLTQSQKISLITYKLRINGSPNARYIGRDEHGNYLFEGINTSLNGGDVQELSQVEEIVACIQDESKNTKLRSVA